MKRVVLFFLLLTMGCSPDNNQEQHPQQSAIPNSLTTATESTRQPVSTSPQAAQPQPLQQVLNKDIRELEVGEKLSLTGPSGQLYRFLIQKKESKSQGITSLSGLLDGDSRFRVTASISKSGTFGRIQTPETTFQIEVRDGKTVLIDLYGPGNIVVPRSDQDMATPPRQGKEPLAQVEPESSSSPAAAALAQPTGVTTIDIMILYTPGIVTDYPGDLLANRLNYLVSVANNAYTSSNINTQLRLVHSEMVSYTENNSNNSALDALTNHTSPFDQVESLRTQYGADLVVLMRPYDYYNHGGCGLAWILGDNGNFTGEDNWAFSVIGDGSVMVGNYTYYCTDLTMTHEIGHNLGSEHDRAHSSWTPAYPYSYGYGFDGDFGTVMSYTRPEIDIFSNPALTCGPQKVPCGIPSGNTGEADNNLAFNSSSPHIAGFREARHTGDVNGDGTVDLKDTITALRLCTGETVSSSFNTEQDINQDGKIGIEEAIYSLQQLQ